MYTLTPPSTEPVTLAEAKLAARIDGSQWDDIITGAIASARQVAEQHSGRRFITQVTRCEFVDWPEEDQRIPVYRPTAVAVSYWSGSAWVNLTNGTDYAWAADGSGFLLGAPVGVSLPSLGDVAVGARVRVDVTSGESSADNVPACVKTFIKAMVTVMVHDPALTADDAAGSLLVGMLSPVKVYG